MGLRFRLAVPFVLSCLVMACQTPVELDLAPGSQELAVRSTLSAAEPWLVEIGTTVPFGQNQEIGFSPTLTAVLPDDQTVIASSLGGGLYLFDGLSPAPGESYRLRVSEGGVVRARSAVTVPVFSATETGSSGSSRQIQLSHDEAEPIYYSVTVVHNESLSPLPFRVLNARLQPEVEDFLAAELLTPSLGNQASQQALFSGQSFAGELFTLSIEVSQIFPGASTVVVEAITEAEYAYRRGFRLQGLTRHNPFLEPVVMPSNIDGGRGTLGGSNRRYLGSLTRNKIREAIRGTYSLVTYQYDHPGGSTDLVATGEISGTLTLSASHQTSGSLTITKPGGILQLVSLEGGFRFAAGSVTLHTENPSLVGSTAFRADVASRRLTGTTGIGDERVFVAFKKR